RAADDRGVRILHELMQHALHGGRLVEAAPEAIGVEAVQQRDEALALRPEPEIAGHPDVVEEDFVVIDVTGEAADRPDVHAGRPVGHHEHAEAAAPTRLAAGAGEDEAVARDARVARPDLVAADHVVVPGEPGPPWRAGARRKGRGWGPEP